MQAAQTMVSEKQARRYAMADWLSGHTKFHFFTTLASNRNDLSAYQMKALFKEWESRVCRKVIGAGWYRQLEISPYMFSFLEKPTTNPHWHLLVRLEDPAHIDRYRKHLSKAWTNILASGSVLNLPIYDQQHAAEYVCKELGHDVQWKNFLPPDHFHSR